MHILMYLKYDTPYFEGSVEWQSFRHLVKFFVENGGHIDLVCPVKFGESDKIPDYLKNFGDDVNLIVVVGDSVFDSNGHNGYV